MTTAPRHRKLRTLTVHVGDGVRDTIRRHIGMHAGRDVAGVVVGRAAGGDVQVAAVIPSFGAVDPGAPITLTPATWTAIQGECGRYPGQRIVGWYRSQQDDAPTPGPDDVSIHRRYFDSPAQLRLTVGASDGQEAWFMWRDQRFEGVRVRRADRVNPVALSGGRAAPALWMQRVVCLLVGLAIGAAGWFSVGRSGSATTSVRARGFAAPVVAHPIVIEPRASVQSGSPTSPNP